ncbi:MAG: transcription-repair coupling factor [Deltaproteobacteria bacterium]|nr:transcription-repair coupling factor [Deltaproteobacteria bacterium]
MFDFDSARRLSIRGTGGSFTSFLISRIGERILFFYDDEEEALLNKEEIEFFSGKEVCVYPPKKNRIFEKEDELVRLGFLYKLLNESHFIGLFPEDEISTEIVSREELISLLKPLKEGELIYQEELIAYLVDAGYSQTPIVREKGEFSKRGSIIDIYAPNYEDPLRIEFMGDEIISIRFFDPGTQRSKRQVKNVDVLSLIQSQKKKETILHYIEEGSLIVYKSLDERLKTNGDTFLLNIWNEKTEKVRILNIGSVEDSDHHCIEEAISNEDLRGLFQLKKNEVFKILSQKIIEEWWNVPCFYITCNSEYQAERLKEIMSAYGISIPIIKKPEFNPEKREWGIVYGPLRRGFRTKNMIVITEDEILGPKRRTVKTKLPEKDEFLDAFKELTPGDFVVHLDYGIGIFRGTREINVDGSTKDFLVVEYEGGDRLYVPAHDFYLLQKYISTENRRPKIDKLGSNKWVRTKARVKKKVEDIANELLQIYAERQCSTGFAFSDEDELFREMETKFEYEETEGQRRAINEVISDMKSPKPMDRLICGDAGFGKTEVALRAAFKAVLDNKQVAILVPTTVLAHQHFKTFTDRLGDYPVSIEMLSRFRSKEEQKEIVEKLKRGEIDIIIGTHRMLQNDVGFKDLGLVIIDEEQRFGVRHKEKLKSIKRNVDVLTLSATPIPRTLYMALSGIKDLSIIDTPPLDRLAIKTYVMKFNDEIIKKGILRELDRGGQVFFVHNYIYNIEKVKGHIERLIPNIKIGVAHGKMKESHLEKVMLDFIDRKYDVLLSTNLIESGLDISNVNTIFINNAHRMGLSELYQLRGRVGRGPRQAYAYLLVPENEVLTREAILRLKIIEEMTQVGAGFYIANYDLEIRGCGNLLGKEQSGNIDSVGFELYLSMLENAVKELREKRPHEEQEFIPEISLPVEAYIPDSYVGDSSQKLLLYKRIAKIRSEEELKEMELEVVDRYGRIPQPVRNLLEIVSLRLFLEKVNVKKVEKTEKGLLIHITDKTPIDVEKLIRLAIEDGVKLIPENKVLVKIEKKPLDLLGLTRNVLLKVLSL